MKSNNRPVQLFAAPRCGAKTRRGTSCQSPAVNGRKRCRMHGGAAGSGATRGNSNALKHGWYAAETRRLRSLARMAIKELKKAAC
jgi:glucans biosynthesis protein